MIRHYKLNHYAKPSLTKKTISALHLAETIDQKSMYM